MDGAGVGGQARAEDGHSAEVEIALRVEFGPVVAVGEPERGRGCGTREFQLLRGEGFAEGGLRGELSALPVNPEGIGVVGRCGRQRAVGIVVRTLGALRDDVVGQREERSIIAVLLDALGVHLAGEVLGDFRLVAVELGIFGLGHQVPVVEGARVVGRDGQRGTRRRHLADGEVESVVDGRILGRRDFEHGHLGVDESLEVDACGQGIVGRLGREFPALDALLTGGAGVLYDLLERPEVGHLLDEGVVEV